MSVYNSRIRFSTDINLGHILQAVVILAGVVGIYAAQRVDIALLKSNQQSNVTDHSVFSANLQKLTENQDMLSRTIVRLETMFVYKNGYYTTNRN